ncbi:12613_t:CDS:2 [Funneliformis mosseae]|uniref:12613_t:CDS:1 n=1 Tax=Funneliformis mosseae TaxID=27381 RepID=A0A9N8YS94_FUNMO|nr:12613_t:CDS:2 [Funneliformis mosseae]
MSYNKTSIQIINELFSDNNNDDASKDSKRDYEDNILEYSLDESEKACQVNFNTLVIKSKKTNFKHAEELDKIFS